MRIMKVCVAMLLFVTLLVSGCVSQSTYDKAQSDLATAQQTLAATATELDATKAQLSKVQSELATAKQSLSTVTADLTAAQQSLSAAIADRDATKNQLSKVQSELSTAQQSLAATKTAQPYNDIARGYLNMAVAGLNLSSTDAVGALGQITAAVSTANDPALKTAWDSFIANSSNANNLAFVKLLTQRLNETKSKTN
jgi:chromosome segregation ATPase